MVGLVRGTPLGVTPPMWRRSGAGADPAGTFRATPGFGAVAARTEGAGTKTSG